MEVLDMVLAEEALGGAQLWVRVRTHGSAASGVWQLMGAHINTTKTGLAPHLKSYVLMRANAAGALVPDMGVALPTYDTAVAIADRALITSVQPVWVHYEHEHGKRHFRMRVTRTDDTVADTSLSRYFCADTWFAVAPATKLLTQKRVGDALVSAHVAHRALAAEVAELPWPRGFVALPHARSWRADSGWCASLHALDHALEGEGYFEARRRLTSPPPLQATLDAICAMPTALTTDAALLSASIPAAMPLLAQTVRVLEGHVAVRTVWQKLVSVLEDKPLSMAERRIIARDAVDHGVDVLALEALFAAARRVDVGAKNAEECDAAAQSAADVLLCLMDCAPTEALTHIDVDQQFLVAAAEAAAASAATLACIVQVDAQRRRLHAAAAACAPLPLPPAPHTTSSVAGMAGTKRRAEAALARGHVPRPFAVPAAPKPAAEPVAPKPAAEPVAPKPVVEPVAEPAVPAAPKPVAEPAASPPELADARTLLTVFGCAAARGLASDVAMECAARLFPVGTARLRAAVAAAALHGVKALPGATAVEQASWIAMDHDLLDTTLTVAHAEGQPLEKVVASFRDVIKPTASADTVRWQAVQWALRTMGAHP